MAESNHDYSQTCKLLSEESRRIADLLGLDAVEIIAVYQVDQNASMRVSGGCGLWHARKGAVGEWLEMDSERNRQAVRNEE